MSSSEPEGTSGQKIDLSQFHETFFQESLEGLSVMESGLLALASAVEAKADPEIVNNVFRAAHSIKGGSSTFGFEEISTLTHSLETILDRMREGHALPSGISADTLLVAVDCLRELIQARMEGRKPDEALTSRITTELSHRLGVESPLRGAPAIIPGPHKGTSASGLQITFKPHKRLFYSSNDPLLYLSELSRTGTLTSDIDLSVLPKLTNLDTSECYLSWKVALSDLGIAAAGQVRDIFEWIEDECDLTIQEWKAPKRQDSVPAESSKTHPAGLNTTREVASLRVNAAKVDAVINLVGELVITQSMLSCIGDDFRMSELDKLREGISQLARNTRELQETVLKMRMLPISNLFDRFPRMIHDLSRKLGKSARLQITGEHTEVDKTVLEKMSDPLVHLLRNSMDHGIEMPDQRREAGKPEEGILHLHAEHKGGNVLLDIQDDGAGLNEERILQRARERGLVSDTDVLSAAEIRLLIFEPGFSTAAEVTDVSGRGVGMDVVRRNIQELGGQINVESRPGHGTGITIQLPLTLAIMEGQLLRVGDQRFVVPLTSIIESLMVNRSEINTVAGGVKLYRWRGEYLQVICLRDIFHVPGTCESIENALVIVVESRGKRRGLAVDELLAQQQVVVKSLEANFHRVRGVAAATILGDGEVAMIVDVGDLIEGQTAIAMAANGER